MTGDAHAEAAEQLTGQRTSRDTSRRLARARALEDIANVCVAVFDRSGEVGVTWPRSRHNGAILGSSRALWLLGFDVHRLLPVHPVAIVDQHRDGCTGREAVAHAREDLGAIAFNLHTSAAPISTLTPAELQVERVDIELKTRGHPIDGHDQRLAMRFARGQKSQHSFVILYEGPLRIPPRTFKKSPRFVCL